MQYSLQDWFFRIEFVLGEGPEGVTQTVDDGTACEDHIVVVATGKLTAKELELVLRHEFEHALARFMMRKG